MNAICHSVNVDGVKVLPGGGRDTSISTFCNQTFCIEKWLGLKNLVFTYPHALVSLHPHALMPSYPCTQGGGDTLTIQALIKVIPFPHNL